MIRSNEMDNNNNEQSQTHNNTTTVNPPQIETCVRNIQNQKKIQQFLKSNKSKKHKLYGENFGTKNDGT